MRLHSPAEEYKRNLRKNEEEKSDQRDLQHRRFLLVLIKIPPEQIVEFVKQLKSGRANKKPLHEMSNHWFLRESSEVAISEKNNLIVELRATDTTQSSLVDRFSRLT